jgi:hypothetical protein
MTFSTSPAKPEGIPDMVEIWYAAFNTPDIIAVFPDSSTTHAWAAKSFAKYFQEPE